MILGKNERALILMLYPFWRQGEDMPWPPRKPGASMVDKVKFWQALDSTRRKGLVYTTRKPSGYIKSVGLTSEGGRIGAVWYGDADRA